MTEPDTSSPTPYYGAPAYPQYQQPATGQQPVPGQPPMPGPAPQYGAPMLPPTNAGWAAAAVIFFWPLAFAAFNHSSSVYPKWALGDYQGAQYASDRTKQLGKIALGVFAGLFVLFILFYIVVIIVAVNAANSTY
ncbi:CD225/dispanin family protein [Rhodococcus spelaei]|uniref:CD225/dispanin family protein n=1 Tax=Rhodococcus spelaei TaxID=2546320 RepID=A0A541BNK9_9NOCA|nr:CD225/dispanin family protein [Rhodococcus spelaei]TQF73884.1 CD225/dispanin family protein [Rhodococcus spelaei]